MRQLRDPAPNLKAQPQRLLGTLLRTYWSGKSDPIPSKALVSLLRDFGVSEAGCRTALSRSVRRGALARSVSGRRTFYRLTAAGMARIQQVEDGIRAFGPDPAPWDGEWRIVAYEVAEEHREHRRLIREHLRALGFGPLHDGVWVSARANEREVIEALSAALATRFTVLRGHVVEGDLSAAWDTASLASDYRTFISTFEPWSNVGRRGQAQPVDALRVRTAAFDRWRRFSTEDPDLPTAALPRPWPRAAAHAAYVEVLDVLEPAAQRHVDTVARAAIDGAGDGDRHDRVTAMTRPAPDRGPPGPDVRR